MADSGPPGAGNLPLDICVESPHQDGSNDAMEVMEEAKLMDFDSMEGGGFVAVSPTHHFTLFHLLSGLDKDVYYVVDADYSKSSDSSRPSLVMAIKESFRTSIQHLLLPPSNAQVTKRCLVKTNTNPSFRLAFYDTLHGS
jgi:hypothetical protein